MDLNNEIGDAGLWTSLSEEQVRIEASFKRALTTKKLSDLAAMAPQLRTMHWTAAFLGLIDLADLTAGAAALAKQIQGNKDQWSEEITTVFRNIVKKTGDFLNARQDEPSAGVFIDHHDAVILGPQLKHPIPTGELISLFRRRQIERNSVSACRQLIVGHDESFSHAITIPSFARQRHRKDRWLTLVFVDLEVQSLSQNELIHVFEAAFARSEILLHGPLAIPWKNYRNYRGKRPYYILLDTLSSADEWLSNNGVEGRVITSLRSPSLEPTAPRVIIREVPAAQTPPPVSSASSTAFNQFADLEPADSHFPRTRTRRRRNIRNSDLKIRFPVGFKLILIVSTLIILAMSSLSFIGLFFFRDEIRNRVEDTNISLSKIVARQAENEIIRLLDAANLLFQVGSVAGAPATLVDDFFANSQSLIYVGVPGSGFDFTNRDWFRANRVSNEAAILGAIFSARQSDLDKARAGETIVINVSPIIPNLESPVIALAAPFLMGTTQEVLLVLADVGAALAESTRIQEGFTTTVIVNSEGELLAHPDYSRVFGGESLRDSPVFAEMFTQGKSNGQISFVEQSADGPMNVIGSFSIIPLVNIGVVSTVLERDAFAVVERIQFLNLTFLAGILSLTILGIYFFSQTLTTPLKELTLATRMIKAGNWNIAIRPRTSDEVGQLTRNFMDMIPHLEARERLREKTEAFINHQVAMMIDNDTLPDNAVTKDVTVFFSDVRGFTSMSETMEDPQLVLDNLSEYFRAMVPCVEETRGTVDKFIGDAIMAVWGSMRDLDNHAESAVNGALMMRAALFQFNVGRGTPSRPVFQIGCGLNSGPATVGIMGDPSTKMEWAHMGDTVNLASRIEALNKPLGTDILISQTTADLVTDLYDLVPMNKITVKGKADPLQIYAVLGRLDDDARPLSLSELRSLLGISGNFDSKAKIEDEVKYSIITP